MRITTKADLAAVGVGDVALDQISVWNPVTHEIKPTSHPAYEKQYSIYRKLFAQTKDLMKELDG